MAFNPGSSDNLMSEINVTPLVDVMLVLLIIFMVTAPMMLQGMDVDLPKTSAGPIPTPENDLVVSMTMDGDLYMDDTIVPLDQWENLASIIKHQLELRNSDKVYLRADQNLEYGKVAKIMGDIRKAGVTNLGIVTEAESVTIPEKKGP